LPGRYSRKKSGKPADRGILNFSLFLSSNVRRFDGAALRCHLRMWHVFLLLLSRLVAVKGGGARELISAPLSKRILQGCELMNPFATRSPIWGV
jgi:hypothetical protein